MSYGVGYVGGYKYGLPTGVPPNTPAPTNWGAHGSVYKDGKLVGGPQFQQMQQTQAAPANPYAGIADAFKGMFGGQQAQPQAPMQVNSSISARPIYNQQQMNGALSKYSSMAPATTAGPLGGTANNLYNQEAGRARVGTDRMFTQANADHLLKSQVARSQSGIGWGRLGVQGQALADGQALQQDQLGLALLRQLLGSYI